MQKKINWFGILSVILVISLIGALFMYGAVKSDMKKLQTKVEDKDMLISERDKQISNLNSKVESVTEKLSNMTEEKETSEETTEEETSVVSYIVDELFLNTLFSEVFSDRELSLFDGEIEMDGEDYDAEEVLTVTDFELLANEEDFNGDAYLTIPNGGVEYSMNFENSFNSSEVDDDENKLEFNLLGDKVTIKEWNGDSIVFSKGNNHLLDMGDTLTVDNKTVVLEYVMRDSVYVKVGDDAREIDKGQTRTVGDLEIEVDSVFYSEVGPITKAILVVGDEVEKEVSDGEEYEEDSIWRWVIDDNSIGIVLDDEFMELDDELTPLASDESICLPNDYVCITYDGLIEDNTESYDLELDTMEGLEYVEVEGTLFKGIKDYEKVLINATGIYDEDLVLIGNSIELGDSELTLDLNSGNLVIDDIAIPLSLDDINVDGNNISSNEDNFRTEHGILIKNPEDSVDDNDFNLVIPEEKVEGTLSI